MIARLATIVILGRTFAIVIGLRLMQRLADCQRKLPTGDRTEMHHVPAPALALIG